jgi:hypothetical protein
MKMNDKEFIREIVSLDMKPISNPGFNRDTIEKITQLEEIKKSRSTSGDMLFLIPQVIYISLIILLSLITVIISWLNLDPTSNVIGSIEMISGKLLDPITISILISFSLLYLIDLYLKKVRA